MFIDASSYGKDGGVEDDVLRVEVTFIHEDAVGAFADADFVFVGGGLALFIKGHDHDGGAKLHDGAGVFAEDVFAFFEGNRVDNAFALHAFESG